LLFNRIKALTLTLSITSRSQDIGKKGTFKYQPKNTAKTKTKKVRPINNKTKIAKVNVVLV
jgi:hypothetical protein